jgi:hypothetical protein
MSPPVAKLMSVALAGVRGCRSTDDVLVLAQQLVAMEQALPPQEPQEGEGTEGEGTEGEGKGEGEGEGEGEAPATDASLAKTIGAIAKRAGIPDLLEHLLTGDDNSHALSTMRSTVRLPSNRSSPGEHKDAAATISARLPKNAILHGQIGRLLVSDEMHRKTHHESSGRLDRRALVRMRTGATDVYSRRDDTPGIDTALLVLIDGSASMDAAIDPLHPRTSLTRMQVAQTAAWHIGRAAESANAKLCIGVFHNVLVRDKITENAEIKVLKPWSAPLADCAAHLAAAIPCYWTPMSPAILAASEMLAGVPATRQRSRR